MQSVRKLSISKYWFLFMFAAMMSTVRAQASNCSVETTIPANQVQIGTGSVTAGSDGITTARGDQKVFVRVKNVNVLGVSYTVTIARDSTPVDVICTYSAILLPRTSVILSGAVFADPPVGWKITVSVGDESDAGVLTYSLFSLKQPASSSSSQALPLGATVQKSGS